MNNLILFISLVLSLNLMAAKQFKIGLVLDKGGRDDKSFNSAAFKGAEEAVKNLGVQLKTVESSDDAALEPSLRTLSQKGFDLVIAIGFIQKNALEKVAKEFPTVHYLIVDAPVNLPNVRSIQFKEHEGSYLVGAIAALTSKTKVIGFIGGMDVPLIRRFEMGYAAGIKAINPDIKLITNYVGSSSDAWKNPMKAKELALSQYSKKADIIFAAAGASGAGVFDAAEETKNFVIGVDSNQNWIKPGRVLTSMLKRGDKAVYDTIEDEIKGKFKSGEFFFGFSEGGIDFAVDDYNRSLLTESTLKKVGDLRKDITNKKTVVPDYYDKTKKK